MPCVSADEVPLVPVTLMRPDAQNTEQLVIAARIDIVNWRRYAITADSLLRGCIAVFEKKDAPAPAPSVPAITPEPSGRPPKPQPVK